MVLSLRRLRQWRARALSLSDTLACTRVGAHGSYWLAGVALIGGCLSGVTGPLVRAVLLNCNTPDTRSRSALLAPSHL